MITAVAMSGGVDSSAAAWLLTNDSEFGEIYPENTIIGLTHWWDELSLSSPGLQERAEQVCFRLGIPYFVVDLGRAFRDAVMNDFAGNYTRGYTPNPCIRCNERIRFSEFYLRCLSTAQQYAAKKDISLGDTDFRFCTGHYVRTERRNGRTFLRKAVDPAKDQSYMLYRVPSEILEHCIFPLGAYTKEQIKKIAADNGFFGKAIKESQDICFIDDDYVSFLKRHLSSDALKRLDKPGRVFDMEGNLLGKSRGFLHYTIGQRKGLGLGNGPWYVTEVDAANNIVRVGRKGQQGCSRFQIRELNWFIDKPEAGTILEYRVQVRYNSTEYPCEITINDDGSAEVELSENAVASPGQSAVFYEDDIVIGGGIIQGGNE